MGEKIDIFYNAIKKRSDENQKALDWLLNEHIYSLVGSIIRMELDSLFRLCYYKSKSNADRVELLEQFVNGNKWRGENGLVTDRKMVNYLSTELMLTWAVPIYDIGCAYIHLSPYHDWSNGSEPTRNISKDVRQSIIDHIESHHHKRLNIDFGFCDLITVASEIFGKIRSNILYELESVNTGGDGQ